MTLPYLVSAGYWTVLPQWVRPFNLQPEPGYLLPDSHRHQRLRTIDLQKNHCHATTSGLNETGALIQPDKCGFGTGSISGITATSAAGVLQYQWSNNNNVPVGQQAVITGLLAGTYHLVIKDINGCTLKSSDFSIPQVITTLPAPQYDNITIPRNTDGALRSKTPCRRHLCFVQCRHQCAHRTEPNGQLYPEKSAGGCSLLYYIPGWPLHQ